MNIKELMQKDFWETDIPEHPAQAWEQGYQAGANAVLSEIVTRIEMGRHASMQTAETILGSVEMTIEELKGESYGKVMGKLWERLRKWQRSIPKTFFKRIKGKRILIGIHIQTVMKML